MRVEQSVMQAGRQQCIDAQCHEALIDLWKMEAMWRQAAGGQYNTRVALTNWPCLCACVCLSVCVCVCVLYVKCVRKMCHLGVPLVGRVWQPTYLRPVCQSSLLPCVLLKTHMTFSLTDSFRFYWIKSFLVTDPSIWACLLSECKCGHERWCVPPTQSHNRLRQWAARALL